MRLAQGSRFLLCAGQGAQAHVSAWTPPCCGPQSVPSRIHCDLSLLIPGRHGTWCLRKVLWTIKSSYDFNLRGFSPAR